MTHGFYSGILAFKIWKQCPVWINEKGELHKVVLVLKHIEGVNANYINYNMVLYPDLIYVGQLTKCVSFGEHKSKAAADYFKYN